MTWLPITQFPEPILTTPTQKVGELTPALETLIDSMIATMRHAHGVGLAAPQVGSSVRICVIEHVPTAGDDSAEAVPLTVLVNPKIISSTGGSEIATEACLSIPGVEVPIARARKIKVRAQDRTGQTIQFRATGFHARIIQHELDHLDGKLIIDYAKNRKRILAEIDNCSKPKLT